MANEDSLTVKIYTRCSEEQAAQMDQMCLALGITTERSGKPRRSDYIRRAIEEQLARDARAPQPAPTHPFAADPRTRGERIDGHQGGYKAPPETQAPTPAKGDGGIFQL